MQKVPAHEIQYCHVELSVVCLSYSLALGGQRSHPHQKQLMHEAYENGRIIVVYHTTLAFIIALVWYNQAFAFSVTDSPASPSESLPNGSFHGVDNIPLASNSPPVARFESS
jgi:hypothetical protein